MVCLLFFHFVLYGDRGSKKGSLRRQLVAQSDRELQKLLGSDALGKHVKATEKGFDCVNQNTISQDKIGINF